MMKRDDLRVMVDIDYRGNSPHQEPRPVSDAELAEIGYVKLDGQWDKWDEAWAEKNGYVKRPDCEACEGTGVGCILYGEWRLHRRCGLANDPCPSCGGSGQEVS